MERNSVIAIISLTVKEDGFLIHSGSSSSDSASLSSLQNLLLSAIVVTQ